MLKLKSYNQPNQYNQLRHFILFLCLLSCLMISLPLSAAAPVTHVVLADKWIEKQQEKFTDEERRSFITGTLFPDIRYLGVISRNATHELGLTVKDLEATQSIFERGKRLHSFVDEQRERLVLKWNIYQMLRKIPGQRPGQRASFLKLVEDEILFNKRDWSDIRQYLTTLDEGERSYKISDEDLKKWHQNQTQFFTEPPSKTLARLVANGKGFANIPLNITKEWVKLIPQVAKDKRMQDYVKKLEAEFDAEFGKKWSQEKVARPIRAIN